ncbi:AgrD family cyclic lactone autoinducer peptide [Syntrophothermus lipocalidus]|uniref:Cyclic lactone autoinducer peptide n=1 Tax=Syntrophothermus lipocalidus (strain DSM 12680 / TGB-C1) TaxID=643648 RepID=D7CNG5_SYNLT|nr:cyclic lactone autoinducer peptide [Syntrophothermus lipocalidus]ADI02250.1 hypothetical protein Slip_1487 [Syntrophothermus lipocalidus DSM 12680]HOV42738.1 cyclic lactone autoinducer peptide [Syntrophothermus lipocalidus]
MFNRIKSVIVKFAVLVAVVVANANLDAASIFIIYEPELPR